MENNYFLTKNFSCKSKIFLDIFPDLLFILPSTLLLALVTFPAQSQTLNISQIPSRLDIIPPRQPTIPSLPPPVPPTNELLKPSPVNPNKLDEGIDGPEKICIQQFTFTGNTVFSDEKLREITKDFLKCVSFEELLKARSAVNKLYEDNGYITTGAYIPPKQDVNINAAIINIKIVEGELEEIRVTGNKLLNSSYIRDRLAIATRKPFNPNRLIEALQLLRFDPLIKNINAELSAGSEDGKNILDVRIKEANPYYAQVNIDNNRSPSAGSFRRSISLGTNNLSGLGDNLNTNYQNTEGSNDIEASYKLPINPRNGTLGFRFRNVSSEVIEKPFNPLDIQANYRSYEISLRQPVMQKVNIQKGTLQELALGLTAQRHESETSILGVDFPLSAGADDRGRTRVSVLRFFQEYKQRGDRDVLLGRSEFSLGIGLLDATINKQSPDSRFFTWRGQLQYLRFLSPLRSDRLDEPALLLRSDVQLSDRNLLPLEQFSLGGGYSVRGYRQDAFLSDNGILFSAELQYPIVRLRQQNIIVQAVPFLDVGTVWNSSGKKNPDSNTLVGVGAGLQLSVGDRLRARLDYGIPLVDVNSGDKKTWQENGLYFSLHYKLF